MSTAYLDMKILPLKKCTWDFQPIKIVRVDVPIDHKPVSLTNIVTNLNRLASSVRSVRR